jgi:formamidopyrimidine-DNA glycosylase
MPELPEVEIISRGLRESIVGCKIIKVDLRLAKIFVGDINKVIGATVCSIERKAKMIVINLDNGYSLLVHLKMTGQLVVDLKPNDKSTRVAGGHPSADWVADLPNQFTHVIFYFAGGSIMYFNDLRRFGYIKLYKTDEINALKVVDELGPDPFSPKLTPEYLMGIFSKRPRVKIKQILLDQTVLSGVGNIYADESLFCSGISPLRLARDIKRSEIIKLLKCIKTILRQAIEYGGSSENTFVHADGSRGQMQNHFKVYRQTGNICPNGCGKIIRVVVGGRGTHYCPECQN